MSRLKHAITALLFALAAFTLIPALTSPHITPAQATVSRPVLSDPVMTVAATTTVRPSVQARAVAFAKRQLGKPYIYGAVGPGGFDCSGLTMKAYQAGGKSIPRVADAQMRSLHSTSHPRWGDLVFFVSNGSAYHVAIYIQPGWMITAPHSGAQVRYQRIYAGHVFRTLR